MKAKLLPREFWRDEKWVHDHYQELAGKYPNQWIAVANKKVISAGKDLGKVERKAERKVGKKDFPLLFIEREAHVY